MCGKIHPARIVSEGAKFDIYYIDNQQARENDLTKIIWLFSFKKTKIPNKVILQTFYPVTTQLQSKNFFVLVKSTRRQESQSE